MEADKYDEKIIIITINDESFETIQNVINKLISFIYIENTNTAVEYFKLRLKDSECNQFSKELLLEWVCRKQPERSKREDFIDLDIKILDKALKNAHQEGAWDQNEYDAMYLLVQKYKDAVL